MIRQLNAENGGLHNIANWIVGQLLMTTLDQPRGAPMEHRSPGRTGVSVSKLCLGVSGVATLSERPSGAVAGSRFTLCSDGSDQ